MTRLARRFQEFKPVNYYNSRMRRIAICLLALPLCLAEVRTGRFQNRDSWVVETPDLRVSILQSGGHVAEIVLKGAAEVNPFAVPVAAEIEDERHLGGRMRGRDGSGALDARPELGHRGVHQADGGAGRHAADGREDVAHAVCVLARVTQRKLALAAAIVAHGDENADRIGARAPTHEERSHQGKDNRILFPSRPEAGRNMGAARCRERLGGLLKYYEREAA